MDWGDIAGQFGGLLEKNVKDPELREWIVPGFSTTTETDRIVGAVVMMGVMIPVSSMHPRVRSC